MNYLSWLIYMADVSNTINWLCYLAVLPILGWGGVSIGLWVSDPTKDQPGTLNKETVERLGRNVHQAYRSEEKQQAFDQLATYLEAAAVARAEQLGAAVVPKRTLKSVLFKPVATLVAVLVTAVAVPSPITLYAIAASETGERVVQSETAKLAIDALNR